MILWHRLFIEAQEICGRCGKSFSEKQQRCDHCTDLAEEELKLLIASDRTTKALASEIRIVFFALSVPIIIILLLLSAR